MTHRRYQLVITQYKALKYGSIYGKKLLGSDKKSDFDWTWQTVLTDIDVVIGQYEQITELIYGIE